MRALAAFLLACFALAAGAAPAPVPCRNLKSDAQCLADERALARVRPSVGTDKTTEVRTPGGGVVAMERILVEADPEDLPAPEKTRWERFDRALKGAIYTEMTGNDGVRMICVDPCRGINCCVRSNEFTTTGRNAGR